MSVLHSLRALGALVLPKRPESLTSGPVLEERPLHEQYQRIGGGLTPEDVSQIIRSADLGQPARFVDLMNESRQKDGHLQGTMSTRERAVSLTAVEFALPRDAQAREEEAAELCRRIRDGFDNWHEMIAHLAASYIYGHSTGELLWKLTDDSLLLPYRFVPTSHRRFIFHRDDGALRYARFEGDYEGIDLLAEFPGRIVQVQRRIVGDVPAREGLARALVWSALLRNWTLRDWITLAEIGWKPWRKARHKRGTPQKDIDRMMRMLEYVGSKGVGVFDDRWEIDVEWPAGQGGMASQHRELFDTLGREQSKCLIGTTTSMEAGPNGDRASAETRDLVRQDIRESDCLAVAPSLLRYVFKPAIAVNLANVERYPVPMFQTEDGEDRVSFSTAVNNLKQAGVVIPVKWIRDRVGMPEPIEGEETIGGESEQKPDDDPNNHGPKQPKAPKEPKEPKEPPEPDEDGKGKSFWLDVSPTGEVSLRAQPRNGQPEDREYAEAVEDEAIEQAHRELAPFIARVVAAVENASDYAEARRLVAEAYRGAAPPEVMAALTEAALLLGQASGHLGVLEEVENDE